MNLKKFVGVASLVLTLAGSLSAAEGRWEQWLNNYYKNPQPKDVVKAVYGLSDEGYFQQAGAVPTAVGFFSQVFAANPDKVDRWVAQFSDLPVSEQRLMASALWYSGNAKGEALLRRLARDASPEKRRAVEQMVSTNTYTIEDTPVASDSSMNLQWGSFLATGNDRNVTNILAAIGKGQLGESARVSLAFNAAQHNRVLEICRAQMDKQPNEVRSVLRAVINDVETGKVPTT